MIRSAKFWAGALITLVFALAALLSFVWTPHDVTALNIAGKLQGPSPANPLGTDQLGRDILSMIMVGARVSIAVAILAVGIGIIIGVPMGLAAAAPKALVSTRRAAPVLLVLGALPAIGLAVASLLPLAALWVGLVGLAALAIRTGLLDELLMRGNDLIFAFPSLVIAILITAIFGPGAVNAIIAIGIFNIPVFARVTRGAALSLWRREFILAARVAGKGPARISAEHILPNILNLLIVQGTIQFSLGILAEAGLSYVGLGAQPPLPSWGRMLAEAQTLVSIAPHVAIFPGLSIVLTVLGLNLLGDGLRDHLDPRLRRSVA